MRIYIGLILLGVFHTAIATTPVTVPPVEAFGMLPTVSQVRLSPDGSKVALIQIIDGQSVITVIDIATNDPKYVLLTDNTKFKIGWYVWANNEILLVSANYPDTRFRTDTVETRLLKVSATNKFKVENMVNPRTKDHYPQLQDNIVSLLPDDPDHILLAVDLEFANNPSIYKYNIEKQNKKTRVNKYRRDITDWVADQQGRVRLGIGRDETRIFYKLYDLQEEKWRNIWEYELFEAPDITPLGFGLDPNTLYIRALYEGRYAIFKVDTKDKKLPRTLVFSDPYYDVEGALIYSSKTRDVVGVYHGEAEDGKVYWAEDYIKFQAVLDRANPDAYNTIVSASRDERRIVVYSSSDKSPGTYFLVDRDKGTMEYLVTIYPMLENIDLSGKQKIAFKARDSLQIEGYITEPWGGVKKQQAAIVFPHGGPMARDYGGFDEWTEFFASRGYLVMQPNFRGSSGYGFDFEMAAISNLGGTMQDDLQDAAEWLVENYSVDKNKICIVGASYGGYAALMAAARQSETFRCAASINGLTDLVTLIRDAKNYTNYKVAKKQFGSSYFERKENSPVTLAEEMSIPILLIHGENDRVVPVDHSQKMYKRLQKYGKKVKYVELKNGGHSLRIEENRIATLTELESFLAENLNP